MQPDGTYASKLIKAYIAWSFLHIKAVLVHADQVEPACGLLETEILSSMSVLGVYRNE